MQASLSGQPAAGVRGWGQLGIRVLPAQPRPPGWAGLRAEMTLQAARVSDQVPGGGDGLGLPARSGYRERVGTSPPPRRTTDDPNRSAIMRRILSTLLLIAAAGPRASQDTSKPKRGPHPAPRPATSP